MSANKSWFASVAPSKSRFLSSSVHELPRWRTPSPMAASTIPPPIVQSTYLVPSEPSVEPPVVESPSIFDQRQSDIEADLQFLLDAQEAGLMRGLEGGSIDDRSSTGSTTPTIQSVRTRSSRRLRRPAQRQPGLRSARKGIYNSIAALSTLKDEELQDNDDQLKSNERTLEQIAEWETKRQGLKDASENIDSSEDTGRVQRLKQEADTLQADINQVELQLADMKSRHKALIKQATAIENSVQAKMASYSSSLRLMEEDIQRFLSFSHKDENAPPLSSDGKLSVWRLPPKRRNLDMAREFYREQQERILTQRQRHEAEKEDLIAGAALWKEAVKEITEFEKRLRGETAPRQASPNSVSAWDDSPGLPNPNERMKDMLQAMNALLASLTNKYSLVEEKNWRLLIAALGAELDALRQGKDILTGALGVMDDNLIDAEEGKIDSGDEIRALDRSFEASRETAQHTSDPGDDHDEPDPELLFSRQDTDTE